MASKGSVPDLARGEEGADRERCLNVDLYHSRSPATVVCSFVLATLVGSAQVYRALALSHRCLVSLWSAKLAVDE